LSDRNGILADAMRAGCVVVLVLVAACGSEKRQPPKAAPKDAGVTRKAPVNLGVVRFDTEPVPLPQQKGFTILQPGKGTATELRYARSSATTTYTLATTLTTRRLQQGQWGKPVALPAIKNTLVLTTTDAIAPIAVKLLPGEIAGPATPDATQYLDAWKPLEGKAITVEVDARGQLGTLKVDGTVRAPADKPGDTDELVQRLHALAVPVPAEPVAIGAQWRAVTVLRQRPAIVKQTATYTLIAKTKTSWKIGVEILRVGEPQLLLDAGIPADMIVELVALVRKFKGTLTVDPTRALPTGKLTVESSLHVRMTGKDGSRGEEIVEDSGTVTLTATK
jgi:hypothetical protein